MEASGLVAAVADPTRHCRILLGVHCHPDVPGIDEPVSRSNVRVYRGFIDSFINWCVCESRGSRRESRVSMQAIDIGITTSQKASDPWSGTNRMDQQINYRPPSFSTYLAASSCSSSLSSSSSSSLSSLL